MTAAIQVMEMLAIIVLLVAAVGAGFYAVCWLALSVVQFFPVIGKRHRHERWRQLTKRSGRH